MINGSADIYANTFRIEFPSNLGALHPLADRMSAIRAQVGNASPASQLMQSAGP